MPWASVRSFLAKVALAGLFFLRAGDLGCRGGDLALDQGLEPGPGDASVGGLGDRGVDVGGLGRSQVAGPLAHVPGVGGADLAGLDPGPQVGEPVVQVQGVGDQLGRGERGASDPGAELGGGELADLRGAGAAQAAGSFAAGPVGLSRVEPVRVVQDRQLVGRAEQVGLGFNDGPGAGVGEGEDVVLTHLLQRQRRGHGSSLAATTGHRAGPGGLLWISGSGALVVDGNWTFWCRSDAAAVVGSQRGLRWSRQARPAVVGFQRGLRAFRRPQPPDGRPDTRLSVAAPNNARPAVDFGSCSTVIVSRSQSGGP